MRPLMRNSHDPAAAGIFERILDGIIISFAWTKCCQKESGRPSSLFCLKILPPEESAMARPQRDQKNQALDRTVLVRGSRGIICMCGEVMPIDQKNSFIPCILYRKESSW